MGKIIENPNKCGTKVSMPDQKLLMKSIQNKHTIDPVNLTQFNLS